MLIANELRTGNWILGKSAQWVNQGIYSDGKTKITGLFIDYLERGIIRPDEYGGIPLSAEIFERLGFELSPSASYVYIKMPLIDTFKLMLNNDKFYYRYGDYPIAHKLIEIKYLHHLQNLIYSLTGQELIDPMTDDSWIDINNELPPEGEMKFSADVQVKTAVAEYKRGYFDHFSRKWYVFETNDIGNLIDNVTYWKPIVQKRK